MHLSVFLSNKMFSPPKPKLKMNQNKFMNELYRIGFCYRWEIFVMLNRLGRIIGILTTKVRLGE